MNIFMKETDIFGKYSTEKACGAFKRFLKLARKVKKKLGTDSYKLDQYLNILLKSINFEFNANGTSLIGIGAPGNRTNIDRRDFNIVANQYADRWSISFEVKYSVIEELYSRKIELPHKASFNAYKCGDETAQAHWGCVFPIEYFEPSFHRPEFFGELILK